MGKCAAGDLMRNANKRKVPTAFIMASLFALSCFVVLTAAGAPAAMPRGRISGKPRRRLWKCDRHSQVWWPDPGLRHRSKRYGRPLERVHTSVWRRILVATETFSQKTGAILKVVAKENKTKDDYDHHGNFRQHRTRPFPARRPEPFPHYQSPQRRQVHRQMDASDQDRITNSGRPA